MANTWHPRGVYKCPERNAQYFALIIPNKSCDFVTNLIFEMGNGEKCTGYGKN
jgi:hypothetical protein